MSEPPRSKASASDIQKNLLELIPGRSAITADQRLGQRRIRSDTRKPKVRVEAARLL
jgi:hypothetical protein